MGISLGAGDGIDVNVGSGASVATTGLDSSAGNPASLEGGVAFRLPVRDPKIVKGTAHIQLKIMRAPQPMSNLPTNPPLQVLLIVSIAFLRVSCLATLPTEEVGKPDSLTLSGPSVVTVLDSRDWLSS
jgi:hypothetical protein